MKIFFLIFTVTIILLTVSCEPENSNSSSSGTETVESTTVEEATDDNTEAHFNENDYNWGGETTYTINLSDNSITSTSDNVGINGSVLTVNAPGNYIISGILSDGQLITDTEAEGIVRLIFSGVSIHNSNGPAVLIKNTEHAMIVLNDNTENTLSDGSDYDLSDDEDINATLFSKQNLSLTGSGTLNISANYQDGITSKDGLVINSGTYLIEAADDGIRGKDYLIIKGGTFTVDSQGDGIKSDNDNDSALGYISIESGTFVINTNGDGITAQNDLLIATAAGDITTGGGSSSAYSTSVSRKGLKAGVCIYIQDGTYNLNTSDDALHSNNIVSVDKGNFSISSGDDGIHADAKITLNGGDYDITKSYEGIESVEIEFNGGTYAVVSSDDGINGAGGSDGSGFDRPGDGMSNGSSALVTINDGYIYMNAGGDGLDSNGKIVMDGGTMIIAGPTSNGNGAIDYDGSFYLNSGILVAAGSSGMAEAPGSGSEQYSVLVNLTSSASSGEIFHVQNSEGDEIFTFAPEKRYQSVVFSSPELTAGESYEIYQGGSHSGDNNNGWYTNGEYTEGTNYYDFIISNKVTTIGSAGRR